MDIKNYFSQPAFDYLRAYTLAIGCGLQYDQSNAAQFTAYVQALGGGTYTQTGLVNFRPPFTIFSPSPGLKILCMAGIESFSQFLRYYIYGNQSANLHGTGNISEIINVNYDAQRTAITGQLTVGATTSAKNTVILAAHSAGGPFVAEIANDLKQNFATLVDVKNVYLFGSPKTGDTTFTTGLGGIPVHNIAMEDDWIVKFPAVNTEVAATTTDLSGNRIVRMQGVRFIDVPDCYTLHFGGGIQPTNNHNGIHDVSGLVSVWALINTNGLPEEHQVATYINELSKGCINIKRHRGGNVADLIQLLEQLDEVEAPDMPANVELTIPQLNPIRQPSQLPAPPTGGSSTIVRSAVMLTPAVTQQVNEAQGGDRNVAKAGDGMIERIIRDMATDIIQVRQHQASVAAGQRRGTEFVLGDAVASDDVKNAFDTVYNHIASLNI
jgi:hypothetical protein